VIFASFLTVGSIPEPPIVVTFMAGPPPPPPHPPHLPRPSGGG
jgi:hypothetical protein